MTHSSNRPAGSGRRRQLLVVCRANRARSPVAAQVIRLLAEQKPGTRAPRVLSSGVYAVPGEPLLPCAADVLQEVGAGTAGHSARRFRVQEAVDADIVLTFETSLVTRMLAVEPALTGKVFTLREALRLSGNDQWQPEWNGNSDLALHLHRMRPRTPAGDDETPDPATRRRRVQRRLMLQMVADVRGLAPVLLGP